MFWNKNTVINNTSYLSDTLQLILKEMDQIDKIYADLNNVGMNITISSFIDDKSSRKIIESYLVKSKRLAQYTQDSDDLKKMHEGNGGYWGQYQRNYEDCQQRLTDANHRLQIEKEMYMKLYQKNRELEAKLYTAEREIEILKLLKQQEQE